MARESIIEGYTVASAKRLGIYTRKQMWVDRAGAPDRVFIHNGRVVYVEFKADYGVLSARQEREHKELKKAGAEVMVISEREEADKFLEGLQGI